MNHEKLFLQYLDGKAGPDTKRRLLELLKDNEEAREEFRETYKKWSEDRGKSFNPRTSLYLVMNKAGAARRRSYLLPVLSAVAVAAAIAAIVLLTPLDRRQTPAVQIAESELYTYPESDSPLAVLSDGQVLHSDAVEMQVSCTGSGIRIDGHEYPAAVSSQACCMLDVPYGHRASVQFADGSTVKVNSHSRIIFPLSFGKERGVRMIGEALFDVNRDEARPFVVEFDDVRVRVLGTRFLVSGYESDPHRVALVSGSVNVSLKETGSQSVTLAPNQMYTLDDNGKINVEDVSDWHNLLDWADGVYRADGTSMKEILSCLARYYGETVECEAPVADIACTGTLYLRPAFQDMLSELSIIFPINSCKRDGVWFVSRSGK